MYIASITHSSPHPPNSNREKKNNKLTKIPLYVLTYPEFGQCGREAPPAQPRVPVLGLLHDHFQGFHHVDDVIDPTAVGTCNTHVVP